MNKYKIDFVSNQFKMERLSRSGLLSNDLDSSNDIFGETPEPSPVVRSGFRQVKILHIILII